MKKRVLVGMSGGVDSSAAALLLRDAGYETVGVTFMLWGGENDSSDASPSKCCSADDISDARYVCAQLGIPHYVFNFKELFKTYVVDRFVREYEEGRTPNPCILCNRHIKFDAFYQKARELGFDCIATGHYAKNIYNPQSGRWELRRADYREKDQSYVLYHLTQEQLAAFLLPLGGYPKEEIRQMAERAGLVVARKPDSQDICFVPDGDYGGFLERYTGKPAAEGFFVDRQGNILGRHRGISHYTVGQRKGLGISLGKPVFVWDISPKSGNITLVEDEGELFGSSITVGDMNWGACAPTDGPLRAQVKIRYSHQAADALVTPMEGGRVHIAFDAPQRAPTKGQAAVLYDGDRVLAGGTIESIP